MPVHRQTNRRRVSDAVVCAVLRDRVSNHLPIDAKSFRDLNFACGSDRFSRLRREVLRELEDDFATSREKPSAHTGDAAAPVAVVSGVWRSQDRAISEPADLQRAGDTRAVRSVRPTFRSGVAMICGHGGSSCHFNATRSRRDDIGRHSPGATLNGAGKLGLLACAPARRSAHRRAPISSRPERSHRDTR